MGKKVKYSAAKRICMPLVITVLNAWSMYVSEDDAVLKGVATVSTLIHLILNKAIIVGLHICFYHLLLYFCCSVNCRVPFSFVMNGSHLITFHYKICNVSIINGLKFISCLFMRG